MQQIFFVFSILFEVENEQDIIKFSTWFQQEACMYNDTKRGRRCLSPPHLYSIPQFSNVNLW